MAEPELISKTMQSLKQNHMEGLYLKDKAGLLPLLESLVPKKSTIGSGDSITLEELGVFEYFRNHDYIFYDKHKEALTAKEKKEIYLKNFSADTFITGCNAISSDGCLVNIDGNGSRVAPMLYGPLQVIFVVGTNKITETLEQAKNRARQVAGPLDARRLRKNTPCATLGYCIDCHHKERICNSFVVIAGQLNSKRIKVVIVEESLGF